MNKINSILSLINKFRIFIINSNFLLIKKEILISFSGGQDSICLLILLILLQRQLSLYFEMIYCNHLWSFNSLYTLLHIFKINFNLNKKAIFALNIKKKFTEKSARLWRYSTLYRVSQFYNYQVVLTAHSQTDKIETFFLNLFRSSSKEGLSVFASNRIIISKSTKEIFLSENDLSI
uniref:Hypothetical chloroplast RF62 n=1 Tax=Ostreobium sp. OS1B TaxID=1851547 RepID=A0A173CTG6_9CHLO|nr:hypothetical chloroplast RF62 [Ostreobium sp. OS1B]